MRTPLLREVYRNDPAENKSHELLKAALAYAKRGIPVFPLKPGGKEPLTPHGFRDATTNETQITGWWRRWPDANIGIPTGERSGLLVLDVDPDDGGNDSLMEWVSEDDDLPYTTVILIGGGGYHHVYRYPPGSNIRNSAGKLGPGLDIRGEGGYVVAPPSVTEEPYRTLHERPLAGPQWLSEALRGPSEPSTRSNTSHSPTPHH